MMLGVKIIRLGVELRLILHLLVGVDGGGVAICFPGHVN